MNSGTNLTPPRYFSPLFMLALLLFLVNAPFQAEAGALFDDSGQSLGNANSQDVALADLDGDGDADAFTANSGGNRVWLNAGNGFFAGTPQLLGNADTGGVAVADVDGDGDQDALTANLSADNVLWLNDGNGSFAASGATFDSGANSHDVVLADFDDDGDPDAFVANNGFNQFYRNDGAGNFTLAQTLGLNRVSREATVADVNGDGNPDVYIANGSAGAQADQLWLNDGSGFFSPAVGPFDLGWNEGAALADLDGDGDPDLYLANWTANDTVWINQGGAQGGTPGIFLDSGQALAPGGSTDVALLDVDDDGDHDAVVARWVPDADQIWLNDGSANFTLDPETLSSAATYEVGTADLDGDLDPDLYLGEFGGNTVWFLGGLGPPAARFDVDARPNDAGHLSLPWATFGPAQLSVRLSYPPPNPLLVRARIEATGATMTDTLPFAIGQTQETLAVDNPLPNPSETVTLTLSVASTAKEPNRDLVNPLSVTFVDPAQGNPSACILCYIDWLLKLMGFDTVFWELHHLQLTDLRAAPSWEHYDFLFGRHGGQLGSIVAANPSLLWQSFDTLEMWTPAVVAADNGSGHLVTVTPAMAAHFKATLIGFRDDAAPNLATHIDNELLALDIDSLVGQTMDDFLERLENRIDTTIHVPIMARP